MSNLTPEEQALADRLEARIKPVANGYIVKAGAGPLSWRVFNTWEEVVADLTRYFAGLKKDMDKVRRTR